MGYVYLGLGLGGVVSPLLSNSLIRNFGWRHALEFVGSLVMIVLIPVGIFVTRSAPADLGLSPDGPLGGDGSLLTDHSGFASRPVDVQSALPLHDDEVVDQTWTKVHTLSAYLRPLCR